MHNPKKEQPAPLTEGVDFYLERGRYVFTAHFLKKRGYCCKSGCRHCPYRENGKVEDEEPKTA